MAIVHPVASADERLVAHLVAREDAAWEALLARHGGMIEATCRRTLRQAGQASDEAAVADAVAEVFRTLLQNDGRILRRFRPGASLGTYLHMVARNRTISLLRRRAPSGVPWLGGVSEAEDPAALALAAERRQRLGEALESLPEREAELLDLFYLKALSYREISARTGVPPEQVGVGLLRAREHLRARLGEDLREFP